MPDTERELVLNGIKEDILEFIDIEAVPVALNTRIQNRLYEWDRQLRRQARSAVMGAMEELLARVLA